LDFDDVSVYEMNLLISANSFDEVSKLAEMSQHFEETQRVVVVGGKKNRLMTTTKVLVIFVFILPRHSLAGVFIQLTCFTFSK